MLTKRSMTSLSSSGRIGVKSPTHGGGMETAVELASDIALPLIGFKEGFLDLLHASNSLWKPTQASNPPVSGSRLSVRATKAWIGRHFRLELLNIEWGQQSKWGVKDLCNSFDFFLLWPVVFSAISLITAVGNRKQTLDERMLTLWRKLIGTNGFVPVNIHVAVLGIKVFIWMFIQNFVSAPSTCPQILNSLNYSGMLIDE